MSDDQTGGEADRPTDEAISGAPRVVLDAVDDLPACSECGAVAGSVYVPVREGEAAVGDAVCGDCGWQELGEDWSKPTVEDLDADVLVQVDEQNDERSAMVTDFRE